MTDWWPYPTNFSGTEANGVADFFVKYPSLITNDYFGMAMVLVIWVISFALSMGSGSRKALAVASFIAFVFSIYFIRLGVINMIVSIVLVVLTIIGALGKEDGI